MRCPYCRVDNDKVIDSRTGQDGFAIRRRRECVHCARRFTTYERVEEPVLNVVKKDGIREPFDREKIKVGLRKACWKRPVSDEQLESIITAVENEAYASYETEIQTRDLGNLVMQQLRDVDQVAYVRFASVYREFKDVRDFVQELQPILAESKRAMPNQRLAARILSA